MLRSPISTQLCCHSFRHSIAPSQPLNVINFWPPLASAYLQFSLTRMLFSPASVFVEQSGIYSLLILSFAHWFTQSFSESQLRAILPGGAYAVWKDISRCHNWGGGGVATGMWWVEGRDAAKYATVYQRAHHNKEVTGLKCQKCQDSESLTITEHLF